MEERKREQRALCILFPPLLEWYLHSSKHRYAHACTYTCPLVTKGSASYARVYTHAEKAASDACTRVCTRESIVRSTEEVRGWQPTACRHFFPFSPSSFNLYDREKTDGTWHTPRTIRNGTWYSGISNLVLKRRSNIIW